MFFLWPVLGLVGKGFITDGALDFSAVGEVFARDRTWRVIRQTLLQAAGGTAISVVLGIPGAYLLYRRRWPGRQLVRAIVTIPFVLPSVVVGVAFRALLASSGPLGFLGLDSSYWAIVAALVFFNYSVVVRTVGSMWARLDPRTAEAAAVLGAPPWRVFRDVTLPALGPAIASAAALVFLYSAGAYGVVLILGGLGRGTVETEIYLLTTQFLDLRGAAVLSIVQLVIVVAALVIAGRARAASERSLGLRAIATASLRLRGPGAGIDRAAVVITAVVVLGLLVTPMAHLLLRSLQQTDGTWGLANFANLAGYGEGNGLNVTVWDSLTISVQLALLATLIALVLGVMVSVLLTRRPTTPLGLGALSTFDAAFMLPLGISAVTLGFGYLITLNRPPFDLRSSLILIPIAQAVVALPMVVRAVVPVLRAIDPRQREAAATLGASPARVFATVDGPHLARSLGLALGFAFTISLGEFGATSFLARPETMTLPVVIYRLIGRPGAENFGMAMAACVVLALLTALAMAFAEQLRIDSQEEW